jgi:3'-5' exoribonuclease
MAGVKSRTDMATKPEEVKKTHLWIKDMKEEDRVHGLYLVKVKRVGTTKKGTSFLSLTLGDRTGEVEAKVWERADTLSPLFKEGDIIHVEGYTSSYRNQIQVTLSNLKVPEDRPGDPDLFIETSTRDVKEMLRSLRKILKGIENHFIKSLIEKFLSDRLFIDSFKRAPAAKNFHHAYLGGLLEHTLSVCQMGLAVAEHYPELDKDMLMAGAFLHDVGKIKEFHFDRRIDYTDEGRLLGHVVLGVGLVDEKLADLKDFPEDLAFRLKHLILSHHGEFEFGSPKRPKFLEAYALHLIDDLDAKMNGLGRFMEKDRKEGDWTDFNRLFDRYFLKRKIPEAEQKNKVNLPEDDRQKVLFS